jgi:drug/metabolite transporter (DMT)-like permease
VYTWLVSVSSPSRLSTYAYVNPAIAVFLGWALAGEPLGMRTVAATIIIVAGVVLVTRRKVQLVHERRRESALSKEAWEPAGD